MSLILLIDTSSDLSMAGLSEKGKLLALQKGRPGAAFSIHKAIDEIFRQTGKNLKDLDAVSVIAGPGSYTGLRVGMAAAKGLCYSLKKELITISSLEAMTQSVIDQMEDPAGKNFCPMIDARRDEVFTALYDYSLKEIIAPGAHILNAESFKKEAESRPIIFFGSGAAKWEKISSFNPEILNRDTDYSSAFAMLSHARLAAGKFENLVNRTPDYLKEFFLQRPNL